MGFAMQIRVMPSCWYILQRFFLRVDGHIIRVRDVRTLCDLTEAKPALKREVSQMEGSFTELSAARVAHTPVSWTGYMLNLTLQICSAAIYCF